MKRCKTPPFVPKVLAIGDDCLHKGENEDNPAVAKKPGMESGIAMPIERQAQTIVRVFGLLVMGVVTTACGGGGGGSPSTPSASNQQSATTAAPVAPTTLGSATLSWQAPLRNSDGSALVDLAGFKIYYGMSADLLDSTVAISNASVSLYVLQNLTPGTWYFGVSAINGQGLESQISNIATKTIS